MASISKIEFNLIEFLNKHFPNNPYRIESFFSYAPQKALSNQLFYGLITNDNKVYNFKGQSIPWTSVYPDGTCLIPIITQQWETSSFCMFHGVKITFERDIDTLALQNIQE